MEELEALKNRIDENFNKAVNTIHKAKGKLIVVGIGKSDAEFHRDAITIPTRCRGYSWRFRSYSER